MRVDQGLDALHCARIARQALDSSMSIIRSSIEGAKADKETAETCLELQRALAARMAADPQTRIN
jgi:hypothetical protein